MRFTLLRAKRRQTDPICWFSPPLPIGKATVLLPTRL
jgi:hypothetical protein